MKLHKTMVDKLLKIMEINSGWKEEWKLRKALEQVDMTVYTQANGNQILVDTKDVQEHVSQANRIMNEEKRLREAALVEENNKRNR